MKKHLPMIVVGIAALGVGYLAGSTLGTSNSGSQQFQRPGAGGNFATGTRRMGGGANGGFIVGQVISADDKSITIGTRDGGSKIVFYSVSTEILKSVAGSSSDVAAGEQVSVMGQQNPDGSVTAQSIQIRPQVKNNQ